LEVKNRAEALPAIASHLSEKGPYRAFIILMGMRPFELIDNAYSLRYSQTLKIIVSASAGYNEFNIEWLIKNGIWFCNMKYAVSEPTTDMAMFLTLAVIRDTSRSEKSARASLGGVIMYHVLIPRG
jgi:lactate dehydrogenase-like 2-hydroxyacid dehydrogenase